MESQRRTRVLIVANRTASTFRLVEAVRDRAEAGPWEFALLIPTTDRKQADWTMETAQRVLRPAAEGKIEGLVGGADPFESVQEAVRQGAFDEIMVSTLPRRMSKWLRATSSGASKALGLPVTAITPQTGQLSADDQVVIGIGGAGGGGGRDHRPPRPSPRSSSPSSSRTTIMIAALLSARTA